MVLYWQDPKALLNFLVRFLFFVLSERSTTFFVVIVFYVQIGRYPIISVCWNFYEFLWISLKIPSLIGWEVPGICIQRNLQWQFHASLMLVRTQAQHLKTDSPPKVPSPGALSKQEHAVCRLVLFQYMFQSSTSLDHNLWTSIYKMYQNVQSKCVWCQQLLQFGHACARIKLRLQTPRTMHFSQWFARFIGLKVRHPHTHPCRVRAHVWKNIRKDMIFACLVQNLSAFHPISWLCANPQLKDCMYVWRCFSVAVFHSCKIHYLNLALIIP